MKVERDIAGMTLPFAVGTATVVWAGGTLCSRPFFSSIAASLVILGTCVLLCSPNHRKLDPFTVRTIIAAAFASCGILCGIRAVLIPTGISSTDAIPAWIMNMGTATGEAIDSIGFRNHDTNAMIKALIVGDRSDIPGHITEAFRESGASHILALSGLHLGIIYGIIGKSLSILGNSVSARRLRSFATVVTCGLYTLATGAGASITRAFIFILLGESAKITGRYRNLGSVLMVSLLLHLAIDPAAIREVGFQLSYAAMAGIAFIYPWLKGFWPERTERKSVWFARATGWIWNTAALSISCQITTGPLAYLYFRSFPTHFLLTNLISLPLTGLIIPTALMTLLLNLWGICPEILLRATETLVTALSAALKVISSM